MFGNDNPDNRLSTLPFNHRYQSRSDVIFLRGLPRTSITVALQKILDISFFPVITDVW